MKTLIFIVLFIPIYASCQDTIRISFNSHIELGEQSINYSFQISGKSFDKILKGKEINEFVFTTPGLYLVNIAQLEPHAKYFSKLTCSHIYSNDLPSKLFICVDSVSIKYNIETMFLSKEICVNNPCSDHFLMIYADIENFYKTPVLVKSPIIYTSGIGSELYAILEPSCTQVNTGKQLLKYKLNGKVTQPTFIQFNFKDNIGNYTACGLNQKINSCEND